MRIGKINVGGYFFKLKKSTVCYKILSKNEITVDFIFGKWITVLFLFLS